MTSSRLFPSASYGPDVIQPYEQGKTRRQIAEVAHMSLKDTSLLIKKHTG